MAPVFVTVERVREPGPFGTPLVDIRAAAVPGQWTGHYRGTDASAIIYDPRMWYPVYRAGVVVDLRPRARGVGDLVARATRAVGVQPCAPCKRRQATLNRWFPFT